jgi:hypothetical protein
MKNRHIGADGEFDPDLASYIGVAVVLRYPPSHVAGDDAYYGVGVAVITAFSTKGINANFTFPKLVASPLYCCLDDMAKKG